MIIIWSIINQDSGLFCHCHYWVPFCLGVDAVQAIYLSTHLFKLHPYNTTSCGHFIYLIDIYITDLAPIIIMMDHIKIMTWNSILVHYHSIPYRYTQLNWAIIFRDIITSSYLTTDHLPFVLWEKITAVYLDFALQFKNGTFTKNFDCLDVVMTKILWSCILTWIKRVTAYD